MSEARFNTIFAFVVGLAVALGAHASGKPWWIDYPLLGDATDIGLLTAYGVRCLLWLTEGRRGRPS